MIMRQLILATATIRSTSTADITPVDGIFLLSSRASKEMTAYHSRPLCSGNLWSEEPRLTGKDN